ncbi:MAG: nucleotidyltransferase [Clostridia bacterium]|nr:nucleotidyltransferase [Clostridia bacterium]
MKTAAIVCEYNPFHNGHKFHIEETKQKLGADAVVLVMSGNFVQRGEVALFDKKLRAEAAIACGADLCIELPAVYSLASAEFFADGAIKILSSLGIVDFLSFGAECEDLETLKNIAQLLADEPDDFSAAIKENLAKGVSFPLARAKAVSKILGSSAAEMISTPNNILAIEYIKAIISSKSRITPFAVLRKGADHDSTLPQENIASATFVRDLILNGQDFSQFVPDDAYKIFKYAKIHSVKALEKAILCELAKTPAENLAKIADVGEGIENRIKAKTETASGLDELTDAVKSKRYTHSRIRRILLSALLGITDADRSMPPAYIRILAQNEKGQKLISAAKKKSTLPLVRNTSQINKLGDPALKAVWERERMFDRIYDLSSF